jgi:uroporphyrinogen decarboxylase
MKPLLLQSLTGDTLERPPVWCMRQAGRYLPEYQVLRKQHSFNQLAETPDLSAEITLQPIRRFPELDAAILFADILTPSRALGFDFEFSPGPVIKNPIKDVNHIEALEQRSVLETVPFVFNAISMVRNEIEHEKRDMRRAVLGFAASPWTLSCYLIDQGIYKQHMGTKIFARKNPEHFHVLSEKLTDLTIEYLIQKLKSGADAVQLFDTWGSLLSPTEYYDFSGKYIQKIISSVQSFGGMVILYVSGGDSLLDNVIHLKPDAISLDWRVSLHEIENRIPSHITIQGNLDPSILFSKEDEILYSTSSLYKSMSRRTNIIANLGHGILPGTPVGGMQAFLKGVHSAW